MKSGIALSAWLLAASPALAMGAAQPAGSTVGLQVVCNQADRPVLAEGVPDDTLFGHPSAGLIAAYARPDDGTAP